MQLGSRKSNASVMRKVVDLLDAIADVQEYFISVSIPLWSENKKQAARIRKLEV
jgi:hypothetical protein